jgi:hypothetical protein
MLDPENAKESILDNLLWTEQELKDTVRRAVKTVTSKMTFDFDHPQPVDTRWIHVKAVIACPGGNQSQLFSIIRLNLDGLHIAMTCDNRSGDLMLKILFEAPMWKPLESGT